MSHPSGPDQGDEPAEDGRRTGRRQIDHQAEESPAEDSAPTEAAPIVEEHPTEVMAVEDTGTVDPEPATEEQPAERRFTAPSGMDSSTTKIIETTSRAGDRDHLDAHRAASSDKPVAPQMIPPRRDDAPEATAAATSSWGWVVALILVIAALAAVAILGTLLLTRDSDPKASQEDQVRSTIQNFDVAVQKGDLATLRSITCGDHPRQLRQLRRPRMDRHPRPGGRGQAVSGGGQHRPGRRQRRPRRGQRDDVHGVCAADPVDPQLRPAVPRRPVEDLPGPRAASRRVHRLRPALCRSLHASTTRSVMEASAFFR